MLARRELFEEASRDEHNILAPVAQRRHADRHDVQPVIKILAQPATAHRLQRVAIGRGEEADVGPARPRIADPLVAAGLHEPQQLGLKQRIHLAQFVEEQRAAIGTRRSTLLVGSGTGEGALDVAEDHAFQQVPRDRTAIQRHEGLRLARAQPMQRFCRQFLAGAGFAGDEHAGAALRRCLDGAIDRLHRHGSPDKIREFGAFDSAPQRLHLALQIDAAERVLNRRGQPRRGERFHQVVERAAAHGPHSRRQRCIRGDDDDGGRDGPTSDILEDVDAVHVRQFQVQQHAVDRLCAQAFVCGFAIAGEQDGVAEGLQLCLAGHCQRRAVLDDQNGALLGHARRQPLPVWASWRSRAMASSATVLSSATSGASSSLPVVCDMVSSFNATV